jgi:hypothetical protein
MTTSTIKSEYADALEQLYRRIIDKQTGRILIRPHLNPDWKIGFIGAPGDCKSITGTKLLIRDFLLHGVRCFSNMHIKVTVSIKDGDPALNGFPGGEVVYETEEFDKLALFRFDERYRNSAIFVDEINLEMAEARRSSSNLNLNTNKVGQELRHLEAALIYTVIDEMWVDSRVRDLTDIFVRTQDTALDAENLAQHKTPGEVARLMIYPMSRKLNGSTFFENQKKFGPYYNHVRDMWEAYDTHEMQASESLKYGIDIKHSTTVEVSNTIDHQNTIDEWAWLNVLADELRTRPEGYIPAEEFYYNEEVQKRGISKDELTKRLKLLIPNLKSKAKSIGGERITVYTLPDEESSAAAVAVPF